MADILISVLLIALIFLGFIGCIVPAIPGPVFNYTAMLIGHFFVSYLHFENSQLWIAGIFAIGVQILDQIVPVIGTKKFGGTKYGVRGSIIGLIAGIIVLPILGITLGPFGIIGILAGPFVGAYLGEKYNGQDNDRAMRSAVGSFLGFAAGTIMKFTVAIGITIVMIMNIFN